jgi:hypothetical protein
MVTLAFGTIIQILINEMSFLTEGPMGIKVAKPVFLGTKTDRDRTLLFCRFDDAAGDAVRTQDIEVLSWTCISGIA